MNPKKTSRFALLLICLALISCSKDDNNPDPPPAQTPKETLMASQWKKSEYKENGAVMPFFASCEMDDFYSFTATDWILNDGSMPCSSFTSTDFYVIESDNKTMRWNYGVGELIFNSTKTSFTFKRTGANTFEYVFVKK